MSERTRLAAADKRRLASMAKALSDLADDGSGDEGEEPEPELEVPAKARRERGRQVVLYLDPEEWAGLAALMDATGETKNALYRAAMRRYFRHHTRNAARRKTVEAV